MHDTNEYENVRYHYNTPMQLWVPRAFFRCFGFQKMENGKLNKCSTKTIIPYGLASFLRLRTSPLKVKNHCAPLRVLCVPLRYWKRDGDWIMYKVLRIMIYFVYLRCLILQDHPSFKHKEELLKNSQRHRVWCVSFSSKPIQIAHKHIRKSLLPSKNRSERKVPWFYYVFRAILNKYEFEVLFI